MINFALMGAGRIGKMHAEIIDAHPEANLQYVYDVNLRKHIFIARLLAHFSCLYFTI